MRHIARVLFYGSITSFFYILLLIDFAAHWNGVIDWSDYPNVWAKMRFFISTIPDTAFRNGMIFILFGFPIMIAGWSLVFFYRRQKNQSHTPSPSAWAASFIFNGFGVLLWYNSNGEYLAGFPPYLPWPIMAVIWSWATTAALLSLIAFIYSLIIIKKNSQILSDNKIKRWAKAEGLLKAACYELKTPKNKDSMKQFNYFISEFSYYLKHNEFELALSKLEEAANFTTTTDIFWQTMIEAAENLHLQDVSQRFQRTHNFLL